MKYFLGMTLAAGFLLALCGQQAGAQVMFRPGFGQSNTPAYSPYLNLLRNGSFTQNYWGLVRPEFAFRSAILGLQQQVAANGQAIGGLEGGMGLPTTGHATSFLNRGRYFLSSGGQGGLARGVISPGLATGTRTYNPAGQGTTTPIRR
jgi:hypothetical protein